VLPGGDTTLVDVTNSATEGGETTTTTIASTDTGATTTLTTSASDTTASSVADTSSSSGPPQESSSEGGPAESSDSGSTTSMSSESSSTGSTPAPGAWEECDGVVCEAGNDCTAVTGLRGNAPFCSPQCMTDDDCPPPPDGDATPICALAIDGADSPTNCALLCAYDGMDYGTCPAGMDCTEIPDQTTPVSLCAWP
jgi:hypothetical protein